MGLFKSLFKPRWQHRNPEVRKTAIDSLDDQAVILELVGNDPDKTVRARALGRVSSAGELDLLIESLPAPLGQQARAQRLKQLLPEVADLKSITDEQQLLRVAELTEDNQVMEAAVGQLSPESRFESARYHALAAIRLTAARTIDDIDQLKELVQQSRGKDKALYRHCKTIVDADKAEKKAAIDLAERIDALIEQARQLSGAVDIPDYRFKYQAIKSRWAELEPQASAVQFAGMDHFLEHCGQRTAQMEAEIEADKQRQEVTASARAAFKAIVSDIEQLNETAPVPKDQQAISVLDSQLNEFEKRWVEATKVGSANPAESKIFQKIDRHLRGLLKTTQKLVDKASELELHSRDVDNVDRSDYRQLHDIQKKNANLQKSFPWPESLAEQTPAAITGLSSDQEKIRESLKKLDEEQDQHLERLTSIFKALRAAVEESHVKDANRALNKIKLAMKPLRPEIQENHQGELRSLIAQVNEFRDWQGFALEPKKVDLCARMAALVDADEDPEVLASRIKMLQDEWKSLGPIAPARDRTLWKEFSEAADKAFEPCREYFSQQAAMREKNFEHRLLLIDQLKEYDTKMNWPDRTVDADDKEGSRQKPGRSQPPEWKIVQKTLDAARQAFRDLSPVTPKGERQSQKDFRSICDTIYAHIKAEYERNIAAREALIEKATRLQESENLNDAINQAKRLQIEWKSIGMTPMKVDRKLWQEFRTACNAIFGRLDQQKAEERAATNAQTKEAEQVLVKAKALFSNLDDEQRLHLKAGLSALREELGGLELPESVSRRFSGQISVLEEKAQKEIEDVRSKQREKRWQQLNEQLMACALQSEVTEQDIPRDIEPAGLENFRKNGPADGHEDALQESCIALEILLNIDSPSADKQARMDYQVKRLQEGGLGQHHEESRETLVALINGFITLRPPKTWVERFCRALEQANPSD